MPLIPDFRPSRAHPDHRAARKTIEKENPHFNMSEFGMKAGALALFAAVALFPWEKEYEAHQRKHHPERFQDEDNEKEKNKSGGSKRRERRHSEGGGERERERDVRRGSVAGGSERGYLIRDRGYERYMGSDTGGSERQRRANIVGDYDGRRKSVEYTERRRR